MGSGGLTGEVKTTKKGRLGIHEILQGRGGRDGGMVIVLRTLYLG